MLYYDRIDISEGIDVNKSSVSEDYIICHQWYFLNKGFNFLKNFSNKFVYILYINNE